VGNRFNDKKEKYCILCEKTKNGFNDLKTYGYIYTLEDKTFKHTPVLPHCEYISEKPVKILSVKKIKNIYNYILKNFKKSLSDYNKTYNIGECKPGHYYGFISQDEEIKKLKGHFEI